MIGQPSDDDEETGMSRGLLLVAYLTALCSAVALLVGLAVPVVGLADVVAGAALAVASVRVRRARA